LKTKTEVPSGKKVKCPKCATIFAAANGDAKASAVRPAGPPRVSVPPSGAGAGERHTVRSGKPPAVSTARRQPAPVGDDEDERPARKRSKKRKKQQNNRVLLLGLGGGGGFLLLGFVLTAFVWPGFLLSQKRPRAAQAAPAEVGAQKPAEVAAQKPEALPKGTGQEDLLNYVPRGCTAFAGIDVGKANENPSAKQQWTMMLGLLQAQGLPPSLAEHVNDVDRVLVAFNVEESVGPGKIPGPPEGALILRMKNPYDPEKVRQLFKDITKADLTPEQIKDMTIYHFTVNNNQLKPILHMPNDRVLVLAVAAPARLANLLTFTGVAPVVGPQSIAEIRGVDKSALWMALEVTPAVRATLAKLDAKMLSDFAPELTPAVALLQNIKGVGLAGDKGPNAKISYRFGVTCASNADSQLITTALQSFWDKKGKGMLSLLKGGAGPMAPLLDEITTSLTVMNQGPQVILGLELTEQTVQAMATQPMQMLPFMGQGMARPPQAVPPVPATRPPPARRAGPRPPRVPGP